MDEPTSNRKALPIPKPPGEMHITTGDLTIVTMGAMTEADCAELNERLSGFGTANVDHGRTVVEFDSFVDADTAAEAINKALAGSLHGQEDDDQWDIEPTIPSETPVESRSVKKRLVLAFLCVACFVALLYSSPDDDLSLQPDPQDAIETAREFSFALLVNNKSRLLSLAIEPARQIIAELPERERDFRRELYDRRIHGSVVREAISPHSPEENMRLLAIASHWDYAVATFGYEAGTSMRAGDPFMYSVALVCLRYEDPSMIGTAIRKLTNLPLVRNYSGSAKGTLRWRVFDYRSTYSLEEYVDAVLAAHAGDQRSEAERLAEAKAARIDTKELFARAREERRRRDRFYTEWAQEELDHQITRFRDVGRAAQAELSR